METGNKYFTEKQIYVATVLGGPIPPGILIFHNLRKIDDNLGANLSLIVTAAFTFFLFLGMMQVPEHILDKIPNFVFTSAYTIIVYLIYNKFLVAKINPKIIEEENKVSNWRVAGLTVLGIAINLLIIFGIVMVEPDFPGEKISFGAQGHEVFYDADSVSEEEVKIVGDELIEVGYFSDEFQGAVRLERDDGVIQLLLPFSKDYWEDQEMLTELEFLETRLMLFLANDFKIILVDYDLGGNMLIKEI